MTTRMPDTLRTELAEAVERILGPDLDLRTLVREMDDATRAIRTRSWISAQPVGVDQMLRLKATLVPVTDHEPDVTLWTEDETSPVYMRRWWLRRQTTDDGRGQNGLYVHVFENDDPEGFHNHPWPSASLVVSGGPIFEDTPHGTTIIDEDRIVLRPAAHRHRIRLRHGPLLHDGTVGRIRTTTLFCTGRRVQEWGFEQPDGSVKPIARRQESAATTPRR